jgi:uncharacterized cupin superfamily protein
MSSEPSPRRVNIASPAFSSSEDDPDGFRSRGMRIGPQVGASTTGISVYELPPGQAICPYHYENPEEEWLLVLEGRPTHAVRNDTDLPTRVLMFSDRSTVAASVYPDSDKIAIWAGNEKDNLIVRRASGVGDWDGETGDGD